MPWMNQSIFIVVMSEEIRLQFLFCKIDFIELDCFGNSSLVCPPKFRIINLPKIPEYILHWISMASKKIWHRDCKEQPDK